MSRYGCLTAFLLVTCAQSQVLNISVEDAGVDEPTCIHGDTPCHTLDYVLLSLSNTTCVTLGAATVYIDMRSSQNVLPSKYNFNCPLSLFISGNGEVPPFGPPALTCLTEDRLTLSSQTAQRSVAVHWQSLSFVNCAGPDSYGLSLLSFNECLVINSRGCVIVDTETVQIQSSKYTFGRSAVGAASFLFVSHVRLAQVYITNTTFATTCTNSSQWTTSVWLVNSTVHIQGHITFENNTGTLGGALRLTRSQIVANDDASVQFINNFAQFGSAVYIEEASCPLLNISNGHSIFTFQKNAIGGAGQSQVYIDAPPLHLSTCLPDSSLYDVSFDTGQRQVSTSAVKMSVALPPGFSVIPGKSILLTVNITDYFHAPVACAAAVYFVRTMGEEDAAPNLCNDPRNGIELVCPFVLPQMPRPSEVLISSEFFNSTLSLKSSVQPINSTNITIGFVCNNNASAAVSFALSDCPPFTTYFNNATRSCECKKPRVLETHFLCSVEEEVACVEKGYWVAFENDTTPLVAPCGFPYCKDFPFSCPLTDDSNFVLLDDSPDDQCLGNSGGLLCRGCGRGYYPTFPPMRCVKTCSLSVSIALLFIAMTIQVAKVIFTNVLFSINKGTGKESDKETEAKTEAVLARPDPLNFAYFYGPLFCLSFLRRLPFQYLAQFQHLNVAVSIYRTLVLPVLDVVGDIPWCFFPEIGTLGVFSFNYFAPLLAYLIFGILYAMRRLCARNKPGPKPSGLRSLSLLILLSFWSLSFTSIGILKGMQIGGLDGTRVEIAPQVVYFTQGHIPLVIVATIIAATLFSFILLLFSLPFQYCARIKKLHTATKPLTEHFQFCFKKGATWFGAVYFIIWMVMDTITQYIGEYLLGLEILLAAFCVIHYTLQPFKSRWANRIDTTILLDLLVCTSLIRYQISLREESLAVTVIVHILVIPLLIYVTCGLLVLIAKQCNCISHLKWIKFPELTKGQARQPGASNIQHKGDDAEGDYNILGGGGPPTTKQAVHNDVNDSASISYKSTTV